MPLLSYTILSLDRIIVLFSRGVTASDLVRHDRVVLDGVYITSIVCWLMVFSTLRNERYLVTVQLNGVVI